MFVFVVGFFSGYHQHNSPSAERSQWLNFDLNDKKKKKTLRYYIRSFFVISLLIDLSDET